MVLQARPVLPHHHTTLLFIYLIPYVIISLFRFLYQQYVRPKLSNNFPHTHTVLQHLDIIKDFSSSTDAQVNCLKNNFKIHIKIDIKTAPTCFDAITVGLIPISATYIH
jgi:hypothetical protein